jgi:hypothetical protein
MLKFHHSFPIPVAALNPVFFLFKKSIVFSISYKTATHSYERLHAARDLLFKFDLEQDLRSEIILPMIRPDIAVKVPQTSLSIEKVLQTTSKKITW